MRSNNDIPTILDGRDVHISITLSNDKKIKELNKKYLKRDTVTDVLSFEIKELQEDGTLYLGDVIVNTEQAQRQAKDYYNSFEEEISELAEHGILHLLGVHHEDDDEDGVHGVKDPKGIQKK